MTSREQVNELVGLVDRLERLLDRSGLSEIEVEADGTTVILRTPAAIGPRDSVAVIDDRLGGDVLDVLPPAEEPARDRGAHIIGAPLTGVFYRSPSPGAEPYVREGGQVNAGQVIGLIEAMKLFNEIKSDVTGTVRHIAAGDGELVKAREALIEVDPS